MYFLRFVYPYIFYILIPLFLVAVFYRIKFYKYPSYVYPLIQKLYSNGFCRTSIHKKVFFSLRCLALFFLIFLIARPQWVDSRSKVKVDGVDTILTIDISASMQFFDDLKDRRSRVEVAKEEAVRYIDNRPNDPMGVVVFGATAISRCPLTLDKNILKEVIGQLRIGFINEGGTALGTAFALSINRLRNSKSKNKVIILITDGVPTPEVEEISTDTAISMAKKFGIKVYAIGIGGDRGGFANVFGGVVSAGIPLDMDLLQKIAKETGGRAFRAKNPKEMRRIYDAIDSLEKTEIETNLFHNYYEAYKFLLWIVVLLLLFEVALRLFVWRGVSC